MQLSQEIAPLWVQQLVTGSSLKRTALYLIYP